MISWYRVIEGQAEQDSPGTTRGTEDTYLEIGHDWWQSQYTGHNREAPDDPLEGYNPEDALWVYTQGYLNVRTAQEWVEDGRHGSEFLHRVAFPREFEEEPPFWGRFDAGKNTISFMCHDTFHARFPKRVVRDIERRWPGARLESFCPSLPRLAASNWYSKFVCARNFIS